MNRINPYYLLGQNCQWALIFLIILPECLFLTISPDMTQLYKYCKIIPEFLTIFFSSSLSSSLCLLSGAYNPLNPTIPFLFNLEDYVNWLYL